MIPMVLGSLVIIDLCSRISLCVLYGFCLAITRCGTQQNSTELLTPFSAPLILLQQVMLILCASPLIFLHRLLLELLVCILL